MPVFAKSSLSTAAPSSARERLLAAATEVFAREGLAAATTRKIARTAGLNEVTLFRHFENKNNLLAAVLDRVFSATPEGASPARKPAAGTKPDLAEILWEYLRNYAARLDRNFALVRVLVGEIQHFQEHELRVIRGILQPERQVLVERLSLAQKRGLVRKDADPAIVADQVGAIVFTGMLRSTLPLEREYREDRYLEESVKTIVRGIEAVPPPRRGRTATAR